MLSVQLLTFGPLDMVNANAILPTRPHSVIRKEVMNAYAMEIQLNEER